MHEVDVCGQPMKTIMQIHSKPHAGSKTGITRLFSDSSELLLYFKKQ